MNEFVVAVLFILATLALLSAISRALVDERWQAVPFLARSLCLFGLAFIVARYL